MSNSMFQHQSVVVQNSRVCVNGKLLPPVPKISSSIRVAQINGAIYVNSYVWKHHRRRRSLKAMWYTLF